jgi:putative glutamine amidotransferase
MRRVSIFVVIVAFSAITILLLGTPKTEAVSLCEKFIAAYRANHDFLLAGITYSSYGESNGNTADGLGMMEQAHSFNLFNFWSVGAVLLIIAIWGILADRNYMLRPWVVPVFCVLVVGVNLGMHFSNDGNGDTPSNIPAPASPIIPPEVTLSPEIIQPEVTPSPDITETEPPEDTLTSPIIPKIVITTRYNPQRDEFFLQDAHAQSVTSAGGVPIQAENDWMLANLLRTGDISNVAAIAELYDGLILTGGGDISARFFGQTRHPASSDPDEIRDIAEIALCQAFMNAGKPILGINRGMQVLNVAMGGDLYQDIPDLLWIDDSVHNGNTTHTIDIIQGSWLYEMFGASLETVSNHHQAVGFLAEGFTIAAYTGPVIEAIENGNALGIQFNPERSGAIVSAIIFEDFIRRCSYAPVR